VVVKSVAFVVRLGVVFDADGVVMLTSALLVVSTVPLAVVGTPPAPFVVTLSSWLARVSVQIDV